MDLMACDICVHILPSFVPCNGIQAYICIIVFAHIRSIVWATLPLYEPIWEQASSRRPKEWAEEPSLWGHNRSSCKAFGKSVTTKEHSGIIQVPAWCPLPPTPMEVETETPVKGIGICLGCKLAKTLALTLGGVWEKVEKLSSRSEDDDTRKAGMSELRPGRQMRPTGHFDSALRTF